MQGQNQNYRLPPKEPESRPRKPWYKKWWVWVIIGVAINIALLLVLPKTQTETTKPTQNSTQATTENKTEFINSCRNIDYKTLARNPDKYKGEKFKLTGKVIQVMDSNSWFEGSTSLQIEITAKENQFADGGYIWNDAIAAKVTIPEGEDRILEGDIIDFYGVCEGLYTYRTVLGDNNSVPLIDIHYFNIHQ